MSRTQSAGRPGLVQHQAGPRPRAAVRRPRRSVGKIAAYASLVAMAVGSLIPLLWILVASVKPNHAFIGSPVQGFTPTFEHYVRMFDQGSILRYMLNSVIVTLVSTAVSVVLSTLGAYSLSRIRPRGHAALGIVTVTMRMLPPIALVVPLYLVWQQIGLLDTTAGLILPYIALGIPLATWMLQGFFMDLPKELEEAAMIDGCTRMRAFWWIILPLAAPGIAAVSIFAFVLAWNDLTIALALSSFDAVTLPVYASRLRGEEGIDWGGLGALTTVIMIPAVVFTVIMRRYLVSGLSGAAVRG